MSGQHCTWTAGNWVALQRSGLFTCLQTLPLLCLLSSHSPPGTLAHCDLLALVAAPAPVCGEANFYFKANQVSFFSRVYWCCSAGICIRSRAMRQSPDIPLICSSNHGSIQLWLFRKNNFKINSHILRWHISVKDEKLSSLKETMNEKKNTSIPISAGVPNWIVYLTDFVNHSPFCLFWTLRADLVNKIFLLILK